MKILMVCLGNICRSPLAEGILRHKTKQLDIKVDSAGTAAYHVGELPDKRSIEIADKYNIDLRDQRARQFNRTDFDKFDIYFQVERRVGFLLELEYLDLSDLLYFQEEM